MPEPKGGENSDYLVWKRPVRAMADGFVISCRRSKNDNVPGERSADANFVKIQHTFDNFDSSQVEYISYLHLVANSIPLAICPNICPNKDEPCDPESEGVDPNGKSLPKPVQVAAGDMIGLTGNSGYSSNPHLHIHLTTGADDEEGPAAGSYPLLFHSVVLQNDDDDPEAAIYPVQGRSIHEALLFPTH